MKQLTVIILTLCAILPGLAQAQPQVLASIRPLQMIAAALMEGVSEPGLLMQAGGDAHHYSLRPSERRLLDEAELLLWVGPSMEGFLPRVLPGLDARALAMLELPGVTPLPQGGGTDPHAWLDAGNALALARALAEQLAALDPDNAAHYRRNLAAFEAAVAETEAGIRDAFEALGEPAAYAVYHDAFQYFERRYGLGHVASFTANEELKPGIRRLLEVRGVLQAEGARCILLEPSANREELAAVVEIPEMRYITVDVMGIGIEPGPQAYPRLLESVSAALRDCLQADRSTTTVGASPAREPSPGISAAFADRPAPTDPYK